MKNIYKTLLVCLTVCLTVVSFSGYAGNKDRSGQAGAQHLLIDPWARSNGWSGACIAEIRGIEALYSNVAGIAFIKGTDFAFSRTQYFSGSNCGISINSFGIAQGLRKTNKETGSVTDLGTIGISIFNMGFGNIPVTTPDQPDGTSAIFSPKLNYIGIHYAKSFNRYIHGGVSVKIVNESISDLKANGVAIDAGIQYVSGAYENFKIGITLKNIGLPISYKGDGLTIRGEVVNTDYELSLEQRSAASELPSMLCLGLSYDFLIFGGDYKNMSKEDLKQEGLTRNDADHRFTLAGSFTANAYSRDIFAIGLEYGLKQFFMVRAGFAMENLVFVKDEAEKLDHVELSPDNMYAGPSAGVTFAAPLSKKGNQRLYIDYSYRFTKQYKGNHYMSLRITL